MHSLTLLSLIIDYKSSRPEFRIGKEPILFRCLKDDVLMQAQGPQYPKYWLCGCQMYSLHLSPAQLRTQLNQKSLMMQYNNVATLLWSQRRVQFFRGTHPDPVQSTQCQDIPALMETLTAHHQWSCVPKLMPHWCNVQGTPLAHE